MCDNPKLIRLLAGVIACCPLQAQSPAELASKAEQLIRNGNAAAALETLNTASQASGNTAETEDRIGFLYAVAGRPDEGIPHFDKALALNADFALAHYHLGVACWLAKDFEKGFNHLQRAVALAPKVYDYRYRLGAAELELKNYPAAVEDLKVAITLDSSHADAWTSYAIALRGKNDLGAAADAYANAVKLNPKDDTLRNTYGSALVESRQPARAIEEAQKVLAHAGAILQAKVGAYMNIGYAYLKTGEFDKAEKAYRSALGVDPKSPAVLYNLSIALKMKDQIEESQKELRRALELEPNFAEAHYSLGIADWQLGDFPGAIQEMKAAIAIRPDYAEAYYMLGITLKQSGDLDSAIPALKEAIRLDPTTPGPFNTLGQILRIKGDKQGSEEAFATGARLKKDKDMELSNTLEQGMRGGTFPKPIGSVKP